MSRRCLQFLLVLFVLTFANHAKAQPYLIAFECQATTDANYAALQANLANVDGCVHSIPWSSIETSQGVYDFKDGLYNSKYFTPYVGASCGKNLRTQHACYIVPVIWLVSDGGNNTSTPAYVYGSAWAMTLNTSQLDYAFCGNYEGDQTGNGIGHSGDSTTFPAVWELPFQKASENFISQLVSYLKSNKTGIEPQIPYLRIGYASGGEAFPTCETQLQTIAKVTSAQALFADDWVPGYDAEAQYIKGLTPPLQMEMSVNCGGQLTWCPDDSLHEAQELESEGLGIGNQGLQQGDYAAIQNGTETSNGWYADYTTYPNTYWREMQTLSQSCPTGTPPTRCMQKNGTTTGSLSG